MPKQVTLERSIANFKTNPTPDNAKVMIDLLKEGFFYLLIHPSLMRPENAQKRQEIEEKMRQGHVEQLPLLLFNTDSQAGTILPVFTNRKEMQKFPEVAKYAAIQITFPPLFLMVQNQPKIDNLLLNPEGNAIAFNREQFLQTFAMASAQVMEESFDAGTTVKFQPVDQLDDKSLQVLRQMGEHFSEVEALWVVWQILEDGSKRWFVIADVKPEFQRKDGHTLIAQMFLRTLNDASAGMMYADSEAAKDIVTTFEPIYRRR
ncbi:SseB family protein [Erysipelotrichaceae bacterium RD49]|nr:SseB family protein [Erysipelotrichaceae bacterium RD49]